MKHYALLTIIGILLILGLGNTIAQGLRPEFSQEGSVTIGGTVGSTSLTISGYQSPFASIILKTQSGIFLASTTADSNGYFSISNVLINNSELVYCFQAVDFKRIGISESCITIPGPIVGDVVYNNVFLPPTIGLSKKQINEGQDAVIFGYSMPGAKVTLSINGNNITVTADNSGYYTYIYKNVPAGVFTITATASLDGEASLDPTNNVILESLSVTQRVEDEGKKVVEKTKKTLKNVPFELWPFLLIGLGFLVAIGILLYKLKFRLWVIFIDFLRRKKKMHHDWFLDRW